MIALWARWRRDLLFTLAGVVVTAAVLVPVGWSQVRAVRQRAEVAEGAKRQQALLAAEEADRAKALEVRELERKLEPLRAEWENWWRAREVRIRPLKPQASEVAPPPHQP